LEGASIEECIEACEVLTAAGNAQSKAMLPRTASMLTKLEQRTDEEAENPGPYRFFDNDNDNGNGNGNGNDNGNDNDKDNPCDASVSVRAAGCYHHPGKSG
jgi:hypothetical protein